MAARRHPMYGPSTLALLLGPFLLLIGAGLGYPLARAVVESLTASGESADAYGKLLDDPVFMRTLWRTLRTAAVVTVICLVVAFPTAEAIHRAKPRWRPLLLAAVVIPLWSSVIARTYGWIGVFQRDGLVDRVAGIFGAGPQEVLYTQVAVTVGMVHVLLPTMLLPTYVAVHRYDQRLDQASASLGAGRLRTLVRVKLPALAPQLLASSALVFVLSLGFFITPAVLGGPRSQLVSRLISQQVFQRYDLPRAQAMSIVLLLSTLAALALAGVVASLVRPRR